MTFRGAAGAILVVAFLLRLLYLDATPVHPLLNDQRDYDRHAQWIALHGGFSPTLAFGRPTAFRPPGYPYLLAGVYKLAGVARSPVADRTHAARVANLFVGTAVVALIGLLGWQLWGRAMALAAMGLAAVYVPLITTGGTVMSEPLFVVLMLAAIAAALEYRRRAPRRRYALAVATGVLAGLAVLTRANAVILLLPLCVAVWEARPRLSRRALGPPLALVAAAVLVVTPWTIRNAMVLHAFVPVTTQLGSSLAGTYNAQARADPRNPAAWRSIRAIPEYSSLFARIRTTPEPVLERRLRAEAWRFIDDHPFYVTKVWWWDTRRMLDLAGVHWWRHTAATITIDRRWADRGVACFWLCGLLAIAGAFTRIARRAPLWFWSVPALMYLSVVFLAVETPRYRLPLDPFVILLAAAALVTAGTRLAERRARPRAAAAG